MARATPKKSARKAEQRADWDGWLEELQQETHRGAALVGAAFLDAWLEEALTNFLVPDPQEVGRLMRGALGSFGARIDAAYCLGLLSAGDVADLREIQQIRNDFAHELHGLSFDSPGVQERCARLHGIGSLGLEVPLLPPSVARNRFIVAVVVLANRIAMTALAAKHHQRTIGPPYKPVKLVLRGVEIPPVPDTTTGTTRLGEEAETT